MKPIQLLSPEGTLTAVDEVPLEVTPELGRDLFRHMSLARRLD